MTTIRKTLPYSNDVFDVDENLIMFDHDDDDDNDDHNDDGDDDDDDDDDNDNNEFC